MIAKDNNLSPDREVTLEYVDKDIDMISTQIDFYMSLRRENTSGRLDRVYTTLIDHLFKSREMMVAIRDRIYRG